MKIYPFLGKQDILSLKLQFEVAKTFFKLFFQRMSEHSNLRGISPARPIMITRNRASSSESETEVELTPNDMVRSWGQSYTRASLFRDTASKANNLLEIDPRATSPVPSIPYPFHAPAATVEEDLESAGDSQPLLGRCTSKYPLPKSTFYQSCFNSVNILMGIGLLSLPFSFALTGWLLGFTMLIIFSLMTLRTAKILRLCMDYRGANAFTYGDIGELAFGISGRTFISTLFFLELFSCCVALVILAADSVVALVPSLDINIVKCVVIAIVVPLSFTRSLSFSAYGSLVGVVAMLNLTLIIFYFGLSTTESPGSLWVPAETSLYPPNWNNVPLSIGLIMAGFW